MYGLLRPWLFRLDAEEAHEWVLGLLARLSSSSLLPVLIRRPEAPAVLKQEIWGLNFDNPIGLAAGFDKDGRAVPALAALGFGFVETGTVTPRPQPGNPRPRLFRLPADEAIINRMGFNNQGAQALAQRLAAARPLCPVPVGVNLGKNKDTPLDRAVEDYQAAMEATYPVADYLVVNVSSPNTPELRRLQEEGPLTELLGALVRLRDRLAGKHGAKAPLLVKVAPDLTDDQLAAVVKAGEGAGIDGYVATNTTVERPGLRDPLAGEQGGLSGRPLAPMARRMLARLYLLTGGRKPLIGVGGIHDGAEAYRRIRAGASLLQIYTGFVYHGPRLPAAIAREIAAALTRDGYSSLQEAVGVDAEAVAAQGDGGPG
ncbi:MAG TPA: quinone-dependent dihydroorotate dehydrogenase [Sphingobacteriaceae bacterium]|nr:quinone-dependent dihydroorotate dehydrogenase [Sphingobacteriaceae bacterium]